MAVAGGALSVEAAMGLAPAARPAEALRPWPGVAERVRRTEGAVWRVRGPDWGLRLLPHDKGRVGAFNDKIEFTSEFTSDRDALVGSLRDIDFGNPTRLYDAVDVSLDELKPFSGRKVVLVFTDGDDTYSKVGMGHVLDRARVEEGMIYAIGLQSDYFNGQQHVRTRPDRGLKKLAEDTGGGYFELKSTDELGPTFTRVAQELHSQYSLAFTPATDGKIHKLDVTVKKSGMTARARRSYQAPGAATQ